MVRRYEGGVLVGEQGPLIDFPEWLRGEISHADRCDTSPYVQGRRKALKEVGAAWLNARARS